MGEENENGSFISYALSECFLLIIIKFFRIVIIIIRPHKLCFLLKKMGHGYTSHPSLFTKSFVCETLQLIECIKQFRIVISHIFFQIPWEGLCLMRFEERLCQWLLETIQTLTREVSELRPVFVKEIQIGVLRDPDPLAIEVRVRVLEDTHQQISRRRNHHSYLEGSKGPGIRPSRNHVLLVARYILVSLCGRPKHALDVERLVIGLLSRTLKPERNKVVQITIAVPNSVRPKKY